MRPLSLLLVMCLLSPIIAGAQEQPQTGTPAPAAGTIRPPTPINSVEAVFPEQPGTKSQGGVCVVSVLVDANGLPQDPKVIRCSDPAFVTNCIEDVEKYRFKPAVRISDGQAMPVRISVEVNFLVAGPPANTEAPTAAAAGIRPPSPTNSVEAIFPREAESRLQTGVCLLSLVVDAYGMPQNPKVIRCSDPVFVPNSIDAVEKYRFKPAVRISDKQPVPVVISVEVRFLFDDQSSHTELPTRVSYGFFSPPGTTSPAPDSGGTYPLTKQMEEPIMTQFVSKGFGQAGLSLQDGEGCHVLLTLNKRGKPVEAKVLDCDMPQLAQPAVDSLMGSKYKPGKVNGKAVPVRMNVHLIYEGLGTAKEVDNADAPSKP